MIVKSGAIHIGFYNVHGDFVAPCRVWTFGKNYETEQLPTCIKCVAWLESQKRAQEEGKPISTYYKQRFVLAQAS